MIPPCQKCLDKWGQEPYKYAESLDELRAYREHEREHGVGSSDD